MFFPVLALGAATLSLIHDAGPTYVVFWNIGPVGFSSGTIRVHVGQWDNSYLTRTVKVYTWDGSSWSNTSSYSMGNFDQAHGNFCDTDTSCAAFTHPSTGSIHRYSDAGAETILTGPTDPLHTSGQSGRWARRGNYFVAGSVSANFLYSWELPTTTMADSLNVGYAHNSMTIIGTTLYAKRASSTTIQTYGPLPDLTAGAVITAPAANGYLFNANDQLYFVSQTAPYPVSRYTGGAWGTILGTTNVDFATITGSGSRGYYNQGAYVLSFPSADSSGNMYKISPVEV